MAIAVKHGTAIEERQMPGCFSRPICSLAMTLNDQAPDAERQRLLPFLTRLACADSAEIERKRAKYIAERTQTQVSFDRGLEVGGRADDRPSG